ncbi:hypothetical protein ANCCEY_14205 [Ancylostoma ceylanicum]|uniref:Uncharacterized protein n=2 Tax=Ancylostoma ceylanicum TaxID=53326 RepID=A0A8I3B2S2_9BILA|nr:hypothetical protein ANCCEY_14205 [Ancylostoma ceylanicum]EYB81256.1 hypothetical protein Y032_0388g495 [Ancylostoma ceylanicum]
MKIFFFVLLLVAYVSTVTSYDPKNHGSERIPRQADESDDSDYDVFITDEPSRESRQVRWPHAQPQDNIPK